MKRHAIALLIVLPLAGCSWLTANAPAVPDTALKVSPSLSVPLEKIVFWGVYAGVAYLIIDPSAPNWEIEEASFPAAHYRLSLHMKR